jgi:hypothetical protein
MNGRSPYDWSRVGEDKPNWPVVTLVGALLAADTDVILVSGRMEQCRKATLDWLLNKATLPVGLIGGLFMRADGDMRPDEIVKREIFDNQVMPLLRESYPGRPELQKVEGVIDDRAKVVRMWRELGLTCVQVAPGEF